MIKGISIKNFKGIGDPGIKLDLEPVTLLFGNNSAGKSTIFHAFLYAYEALVNRNFNADRTTLGGDHVDLGGFLNFVHNHDPKNEVEIEIELDLASAQLDQEWRVPEYVVFSGNYSGAVGIDLSTIGTDVWSAAVKFRIAWNEAHQLPFVSSFTVKLDDDVVLNTWCDQSSTDVNAWLNYRHKLFCWQKDFTLLEQSAAGVMDALFEPFRTITDTWFWRDGIAVEDDHSYEKIAAVFGRPPLDTSDDASDVRVVVSPGPAGTVSWFYQYDFSLQKAILIGAIFDESPEYSESVACEEWEKHKSLNESDTMLPIKILDQRDALPALDRPLQLNLNYDALKQPEERDVLQDLITRLAVGPARLLARALQAFRHIGPLREVPPRSFQPSLSANTSRWCSGLGAWDTLSVANDELVKAVSEWLSSKDRLGTRYSLIRERFKALDVDGYILRLLKQENPLDDLQLALDEIERLPILQRLYFRDDESQVQIEPPDIAVGITQLLPVVVAAVDKHRGVTLIEQPELHNHPAVEVGLGDLFAETIHQGHGRFILETHGEHLMLRMLRRIRETTEGNLPSDAKPLRPEQIAVYFIERASDGVAARRLRIDVNGEFIDKWPHGFFRERAEELF